MPELSAEEPFTCIYAGRDVSDEATTSPVEVGAIAFEDERGAVRIFLGNMLDAGAQRAGRVSRQHGARRHGAGRSAGSASDRQAQRPQGARGKTRRRRQHRPGVAVTESQAPMLDPIESLPDHPPRRRRAVLLVAIAWASGWATGSSARPTEQALQSVTAGRALTREPTPVRRPVRPRLEALGDALRRRRPALPRPARPAAAAADARCRPRTDADAPFRPRRRPTRTSRSGASSRCPTATPLADRAPPSSRAEPRRANRRRCLAQPHVPMSALEIADTIGDMEHTGTITVKRGLAQMLKGGVIMDVVTPEQAVVAQEAGAVAVMALERIPADIRAEGGVARMSSLELIHGIMDAVTIPVMAKVRIGHFAEAQVLQRLGVDYIDESEVLTPADDKYHVRQARFTTPFVCGARDLGEALRRIAEGAAMIRSKGEAGSGNIVEAVRHMRAINDAIRELTVVPKEELVARARDLGRAARTRAPSRRGRQASGRALLRGRRFDAGRCRPDDAARRRRHLRRQRHLQIDRSRKRSPKRSSTRPRTSTIPKSSWKRAARSASPKRCPASTCARSTNRSCWRRAVTEESHQWLRSSAFSRCKATWTNTSPRWSAPARAPLAVKTRADLERVDGLVIPGGESTTVMKLLARFELARADRRARSRAACRSGERAWA